MINSMMAVGFNTNSYHLENQAGDTNDEIAKQYHFREMEADNSAQQWIMRQISHDSVNQLLSALWQEKDQHKVITELRGNSQLFAHKLLCIAFWLVTSLLESARNESVSLTHPLPICRILAGLKTLMVDFAGLVVDRSDELYEYARLGQC